MSLIKILERAGFKRDFEEEFKSNGVRLVSAPQFFNTLQDEVDGARLLEELNRRDFILTSSFQIIERENGVIVHVDSKGVKPIEVKVPYAKETPIKIMPEFNGLPLTEAVHDNQWSKYLLSLFDCPDLRPKIMKRVLGKIANPSRIIIATPKPEKRKQDLRTMITLSRAGEYFVMGSVYEADTTIAYPLVEVPD